MLVRQLEEELRLRMRGPSLEMQQQMEVLFAENEHLTREIAILRETIKVKRSSFYLSLCFLLGDFLFSCVLCQRTKSQLLCYVAPILVMVFFLIKEDFRNIKFGTFVTIFLTIVQKRLWTFS